MSCGRETEKNVVENDKCERRPDGQGSQTMGESAQQCVDQQRTSAAMELPIEGPHQRLADVGCILPPKGFVISISDQCKILPLWMGLALPQT